MKPGAGAAVYAAGLTAELSDILRNLLSRPVWFYYKVRRFGQTFSDAVSLFPLNQSMVRFIRHWISRDAKTKISAQSNSYRCYSKTIVIVPNQYA